MSPLRGALVKHGKHLTVLIILYFYDSAYLRIEELGNRSLLIVFDELGLKPKECHADPPECFLICVIDTPFDGVFGRYSTIFGKIVTNSLSARVCAGTYTLVFDSSHDIW